MGMENDAMLDFLRDNRRFADMFNGEVFAGECVVEPADLLVPVYTVCLYHGEKKWDGPRTLHDMMDFGEDRERTFWEREFANYGMRLVCVNELEDVSKFTTELKEVFEIMNHRGDRQEMNQFLEQHEEYKRLDEETAWVIGTVMGVDVFMENHERYKTKGGYNMCTAIREMWNDGKNEGVNLSAAVFRAVKNGLLDDQEIAALCECTVDEVRRIRTVFGI